MNETKLHKYWIKYKPTNKTWKNEFIQTMNKRFPKLEINIMMNNEKFFSLELLCSEEQFTQLKELDGFVMGGKSISLDQ